MLIRDYIRPLLKWWWLVLATILIAGISTFLILRVQPKLYQARSMLFVGRTMAVANPNSNEFFLSQQLARVYADLAIREPVRNATMDALGLSELPEYEAFTLGNNQLIEIIVTDTFPQRAQDVANELASQLEFVSPGNPTIEDHERDNFINEQLDYLQIKIEETQVEILDKQTDLAELTSARQIADSQGDLLALQDKLNTLQANYASLLATTQQEAVNTISVIEPALLPEEHIGPKVALLTLVSSGIALILSAGAAYLLEYMDNRLHTPGEIEKALQLPILGYIPQSKRLATMREKGILVLEEPNSPEADTFRLLQTGIKLAWEEKPLKTIFVTSLEPGEGKTTIAVNLAAAFAKSGKRVVLVDADMRRPKVHQFAKIPNEIGLSDAFNENLDPSKMAHSMDDSRLRIVTSGSPVANPAEILDSIKLLKILANIEGEADLAIFDGPPLPLPDALALASKLDGVLIVVRLGQVKETNASVILDQLKRVHANLLGVVLNRVPRGLGYSGIASIYSYHEHPRDDNGAKLINKEDPEESAESKIKSSPPFKEVASRSERSTAFRRRKTTKKKAE